MRLVDLGKLRTVKESNIGRLDDRHAHFSLQSTDLCLLNLVPFSKSGWTDYETEYVTNIIFGREQHESFGHGQYHTTIQFEVQPDLMFALDLSVLTHGSFAEFSDFLTQKCVVTKLHSPVELKDFFKHATHAKVLTDDQYIRINNIVNFDEQQ